MRGQIYLFKAFLRNGLLFLQIIECAKLFRILIGLLFDSAGKIQEGKKTEKEKKLRHSDREHSDEEGEYWIQLRGERERDSFMSFMGLLKELTLIVNDYNSDSAATNNTN